MVRAARSPGSTTTRWCTWPSATCRAYAAWAGKELPTEAEWEYASRGGVDGAEYAWGDEFTPGDKPMANTWQGAFPNENLKIDGYERTSPVRAFPPNGYGVHDMIGNTWEWTIDWFSAKHEVDLACAATPVRTPDGAHGARMAGHRERVRDPGNRRASTAG